MNAGGVYFVVDVFWGRNESCVCQQIFFAVYSICGIKSVSERVYANLPVNNILAKLGVKSSC